MANLIREVSKQRLVLIPDASTNFIAENNESERELNIKVINASNDFTSFQIELIADGVESDSKSKWYSTEPKICSKKPPGDETEFRIVVTKAPIPAYETTLPITLKVFSIDSETLFDTRTFELSIEKPRRSLKVYLPAKDLKVNPGDKLDIPVLIYNLSPKFAQVKLTLEELDPEWFLDLSTSPIIQINAGDSQEVILHCNPPRMAQSQVYSFTVRAEDQTTRNTVSSFGHLEVLPYGEVEFECLEPKQTLPQRGKLVAEYPFQFKNLSNLKQQIALKITDSGGSSQIDFPNSIVVEPGTPEPESSAPLLTWQVKKTRPWWGWGDTYRFEAVPILKNANSGDSSTPVSAVLKNVNSGDPSASYPLPNLQVLELQVRPLIPFWLQLGVGILGLLLLALRGWLDPGVHHAAPVNTVRIIGNETTVVSGSSDQTIQRWDISPVPWLGGEYRLAHREALATAEDTQKKAIRVIREIPKREGEIAVGLENGAIQLWKVSPHQLITPIFSQNDRVFDLDFTPDSRYLFSGHGSGLVRQWNLGSLHDTAKTLDFRGAISALSVIDLSGMAPPTNPNQIGKTLVAIAGQFNRFVLWDWQKKQFYDIHYGVKPNNSAAAAQIAPVMGKNNYINSLTVAKNAPLMAMADNRGYITLWDIKKLNQCVDSNKFPFQLRDELGQNRENSSVKLQCDQAQIDQWQAGSNGESIRSVALSDEGCYLTSVGDDGRVILWFPKDLTRASDHSPRSILIEKFSGAYLKSVDIQRPDSDHVLLAFGVPQNQIHLHRQSIDPQQSCPQNTTVLDKQQ